MPLGPDLNKFIKVFNLPIRDYTRLSVKYTQSAIEDYQVMPMQGNYKQRIIFLNYWHNIRKKEK